MRHNIGNDTEFLIYTEYLVNDYSIDAVMTTQCKTGQISQHKTGFSHIFEPSLSPHGVAAASPSGCKDGPLLHAPLVLSVLVFGFLNREPPAGISLLSDDISSCGQLLGDTLSIVAEFCFLTSPLVIPRCSLSLHFQHNEPLMPSFLPVRR